MNEKRKVICLISLYSVKSLYCCCLYRTGINNVHFVYFSLSTRTTALITLFSQYLRHIPVPIPVYSRHKKLRFTRVYIFQILPVGVLFPPEMMESINLFSQTLSEHLTFFIYLQVLLGIVFSWLICYILTAYDVLPTDPQYYGYLARTDLKKDVISKAPWITFPYPGKRGLNSQLTCCFLNEQKKLSDA